MMFKEIELGEIFQINKKNIKPALHSEDLFIHYSIPAFDTFNLPIHEKGENIKSTKYLISNETILVSKLNPRINRVWLVKLDSKVNTLVCSTEFIAFEPINKFINLSFYYQYFSSNLFQNKLLNLQSGSTGSRMRVSPTDTLSLPIPFPPEKEQQKIAAILSSVDDAIDKTEQIIEQTERVKQGLMQQLLTKGIGHTEFKQTEIGEIPKEWSIFSFEELFEFNSGMSSSRADLGDTGAYYMHYGDIHKSEKSIINTSLDKDWLPKIDLNNHKLKEASLLFDGDIVLSDASEDTQGIGKNVLVRKQAHEDFVAGLHTIILRDKNELLSNDFKAFCLSSSLIKKQLLRVTTGATVYGLSKSNLKKISFPLPSLKEQNIIGESLQKIDTKILLENKKLKHLYKLKKGLMQQLLTGKVRVPVDENEVMSQ